MTENSHHKPLEVVKGEYYKWPYAPDVYSAGVCLLYTVKPSLLASQYSTDVLGIHNKYRSPDGVKEYLARKGLLGTGGPYPEVYDLLSQVLCGPNSRLTMAQFARKLRKIEDNPAYHGELPLIVG